MGPLAGVRIIEMAGIGPGPFCGMMLSDMGAEVIRVDRKSAADLGVEMPRQFNVLNRGRRSIALDLKTPEGIAAVKRIAAKCDALIEGFRPGVMERLGLGPDELLRCNSRLVYGRITGWGQTGPVASAAGHDINYISLDRNAARDRQVRTAITAAQPRWRFWRRRHVSRFRGGLRAA